MRSKLASSIAILLNYGAKWRALYYIFYVLCLDYTLSIVLDSKIFLNEIKSYARKESNPFKGTLLDMNGTLLKYFGRTNVFRYVQESNTTTVYMIVVVYVVSVGFAAALIFTHWPSRKLMESRWMGSILIWMINYFNYFLLISLDVFFQSITCVKYSTLSETPAMNDKYYVPEKTVGTDLYEITYQTSSFNSNLLCMSIDHIFISVLATLGLIISISLKIVAYKRLTLFPDPRVASCRNAAETVLIMGVTILLAIRFFLVKQIGDLSLIFYISALSIFGINLLLQYFLKPFYRESENSLRLLEIMILTAVSGLVLEATSNKPVGSLSSAIRSIGTILIIPVVLKLVVQGSKRVMTKIKSGRSLDQESLDNLYELYYAVFDFQLDGNLGSLGKLDSLMQVIFEFNGKHSETSAGWNLALSKYMEAEDYMSISHLRSLNQTILEHLETLLDNVVTLLEGRSVKFPTKLLVGCVVFLEIYRKKTVKASSLIRNAENSNNTRLFTEQAYPQGSTTYLGNIEQLAGMQNGTSRETPHLLSDRIDKTTFVRLMMREFLSTRIAKITRTKQLELVGTSHKQMTKIDFVRSINYFNSLNSLTTQINHLLGLRTRLISDILANNLNGEALFKIAQRYDGLEQNCRNHLRNLKELVDNKSTGLQLIQVFFTRQFMQDSHEALKILRAAFKQHFTESFVTDYVDELAIPDSVCMIGTSLEVSTFNKINLASSNTHRLLGYKDLVAKELTVLIPDCLATRHRRWIHPRKLKGNLIQKGTQLETWASHASGVLVRAETSIRMNSHLEAGLQALGAIVVHKEVNEWLLVLDMDSGHVVDTSVKCHFFKKGSSLFDYQPHLRSPIESFYRIAKKNSENGDQTSNLLTTITSASEPREEFDHLQLYLHLCQGIEIVMDVKGRNLSRFKMLATYADGTLLDQKYVVLTMIPAGTQETSLVRNHEFIMRMETDHKGFQTLPTININESPTREGQILLHKKTIQPKKSVVQPQTPAQKMSSLSKFISVSLQKLNGRSGGQNFPTFMPGTSNAFSKLVDEVIKTGPVPQSRTHRKRLNSDSIDDSTSNKSHHDRHKSRTYVPSMNQNKHGTNHDFDISSVGSRTSMDPKKLLRKTVFHKTRYRSHCLLFAALGMLFFAVQLIVGTYKHHIQFKVFQELNSKIKHVDHVNWVIWAQIVLVLCIDGARQVYDGIIPNDMYAKWNLPDMLENTNFRKSGQKNVLLQYTLYINNALINSSFPHLSKLNEVQNQAIRVWNYFEQPDGSLIWKDSIYKPLEAMKMMQKTIDDYVDRDDAAFASKTSVIGQDRDKDPPAEYIRKNLLGDLLVYTFELGFVMFDYVHGVALEYRRILILNQIINLSLLGLITLVLAALFCVASTSMKKTVSAAFTFKIPQLEACLSFQKKINSQFENISTKPYDSYYQILRESGKSALDMLNFDTDPIADSPSPKKSSYKQLRALSQKAGSTLTPVNFNFGFFKRLLVLVALYSLSMLLELPYYLENMKEATALINQVRLFNLAAELWNAHFFTVHSIDSLIMWGRNITYMDATPEEISQKFIDYYLNRVLAGFDELRAVDMGEMTEIYRNLTSTVKVCDFLHETKTKQFINCGEGLSDMWNQDFITVLKTSIAQFRSFREDALRSLDNPQKRYKILYQPFNVLARGYYLTDSNALSEIYYAIFLPLVEKFELLTNKDEQITKNSNFQIVFYLKLFGSLTTLLSILLLVFFAVPVANTYRVYSRYLQLLPFELSITNMALLVLITKKNK